MAYATTTDLTNRLSASVVRRIYDDNNDGTADTDPVTALLLDATAEVDSYLAPLGVLPLTAPYPRRIISLTLDYATVYAAQRHPEAVRLDWEKLEASVIRKLKALRVGDTMLGTNPSAPDPPANHGGTVYPRTGSVETDVDAPTGQWEDMNQYF